MSAIALADALFLSFRPNGRGTRKLSGIDSLRHLDKHDPDPLAPPESRGAKPGLTWKRQCGITLLLDAFRLEKAAPGGMECEEFVMECAGLRPRSVW